MKAEIRQWVRCCLQCQQSKIQYHTKAPPSTFAVPDARFAHIHVDLFRLVSLTCIDRFTRWTEAIPITDISAKTVAQAFIQGWISRFGTPITLTSDRGKQFESALRKELMEVLGTIRTRTTAYHPATNGMVERFHRQLKASIKCHSQPEQWTLILPLGLLCG